MIPHEGVREVPISKEGVVRTACNLCQNWCGVLAQTVKGKVVKLEGDPDNPRNLGHLCAKGLSGFTSLYSPTRVTKPLIRTNPEKGLGVDPMWREMGWEEAIQVVAERLRKVIDDPKGYDPRKVLFTTWDHWGAHQGVQAAWAAALGTSRAVLSASCFCGNAVHPPSWLNTATFEIMPDAEYAKYLLLIGAQAGSIIHYDTMNVARHIAEKRPGGVKVVAVDPLCSYAASKAEEWVPIRPGTDAAFILALINLLINEYNIYDADFLKLRTNAPYLIGEDGSYVRSSENRKPLVWDPKAKAAMPFDAATHFALDGEYQVEGRSCRPAFTVIKEYVRKYTPEFASQITTIPAETIRRIAAELGEAAAIGSTINIDGVELPLRPVSVVWYRGISAHKHSYLAGLAAMMLPTILGAVQVPGGIKGEPWAEEGVTEDGLMTTLRYGISVPSAYLKKEDIPKSGFGLSPYPAKEVKKPWRADAYELFPVSVYSYPMMIPAMLNPSRFGFAPGDYIYPEIMFTYRDNVVKDTYAPEAVVEALRNIPFIVAFAVELDETTSMADVVFPDIHYLERLAEGMFLRIEQPGFWYSVKPAVHPPFESPYDKLVNNAQILLEIAERAGFLPSVYKAINETWNLKETSYELDPYRKYGYEELADRRLKSWIGKERGLEWLLSDRGGLLIWKATPQERYPGIFRKGRIHLYFEFMLEAGEGLRKITKELNIPWDLSDYQCVPDWKPCSSYMKKSSEYDLYVINYKVPIQVHSIGRQNPLLRQLVENHGLDRVLINIETARSKGIQEGDEVWIETPKGRRVKAIGTLTERIHPEVVGTLQHKLAKGADFNALIGIDDDTFDFVGCAVDACLLAKVYKTGIEARQEVFSKTDSKLKGFTFYRRSQSMRKDR